MSQTNLQPTTEELTGHVYDGIQEYDNPTPGWWTMIFIGSVIFSVLYWGIVTLAGGVLSPIAEHQNAKTQESIRQFGALGELTPDAATIAKFAADPKWSGVGASLFATKCAACHGRDGTGISGPNLTDDVYIHVRKIEDIARIVAEGANNGAMPSWRSSMSQNEMIMVSAYVASLRGQNKPGKAPEANAVAISPWP